MGTLGRYLHDARIARGIDLHDAAQQTRIKIQYLKALEGEDFSKLPGEIFVKGFLKNYGKFLCLDESEVMKKYGELRQKPSPSPAGVAVQPEPSASAVEQGQPSKIPVEPFIWGAGIVVVLILFLFTALPARHPKEVFQTNAPSPAGPVELASGPVSTAKPDKLYLEVIALENTWLLVRTDTSPQKKAVLSKGDSLIWSADESFLLSYGSAGAIKLLLNGQELTVNEPKNAVIRDLAITASGIVNRKIQAEYAKPAKPKGTPVVESRPSQTDGAPGHKQQSQPALLPQAPPKQKPVIESRPSQTIGAPVREQQQKPAVESQPSRTAGAPVSEPRSQPATLPQVSRARSPQPIAPLETLQQSAH